MMVLVVALLSVAVAAAVVVASIWIIRSNRTLNDRRSQTAPKPNVVRLVIDGCNGPIRIKTEETSEGLSIQLVFAFHGEQGKLIDLLPRLQSLCSSAVVVFDGCSKRWPFDVSQRSFEWQLPKIASSRPHTSQHVGSVSVVVTSLKEEADNVIAQMDKYALECRTLSSVTNDDDVKLPIVRLIRSDQGPGRQKNFLRPLQLLQSNSVAYLYPHDDWSQLLNLQAQKLRHQLCQPLYKSLMRIEEEWLQVSSVSIVVTDDVYLRQRVQHCMSFQQLHDFLIDDVRVHRKQH